MSEAEFAALPSTLVVREVCLRLHRRGFRDQTIIVVTTLLDTKRYSAWQLTQLYDLRWQSAEVNLRHLKTTLNLEMLTAKTPEMVRKEIWTHLLAYTLLRTLMWKTATPLEHTSFQLSLQVLTGVRSPPRCTAPLQNIPRFNSPCKGQDSNLIRCLRF